ncbi:hypothetical protein DPEC_G00215520 [Dallia pectoralis]|uniref:Uncharacterized protein n=1 Tax=Dallia pectoralis TaxID=75939 RepID=A0ACC2G2J4_DALPE|nr:hypothetical protein DPEC_G00215520 [Dallia pectoralis]
MAADGGMKPLQNAMKLAKLAIQLDAGNRHKEAYCEYLRSINYISHALLEDAESIEEGEMVAEEVEKMLKLAEQCLERAKSFIGREESLSAISTTTTLAEPSYHSTTATSVAVCPGNVVSPQDPDTESKLNSSPGHRRALSDGGGGLSPFLPPEVFQRLQTIEPLGTRKELTPIEEASRLNQKLKANYEARLARLPPAQARTQKTSLTLSFERQMMENLIIAKARQDALQRKMEERRLRLQEEANRRFAASGSITAEEPEQRVLYTNVLEYEQDHDWPKLWKAKLKKYPDDVTLASGLVSRLLSCPDHPVMKLLKRHQYRVYNRLYPIVSKCLPASPALSIKPSHSTQSLSISGSRRRASESGVGHSLSSNASLNMTCSNEHNSSTVDSGCDGHHTPNRENSFEDLEQFLSQLDWQPCHGDHNMTFEPSHQVDQETLIKDLEMRALKDHLKAIVKDIHNAIDQLLSLCLLSFECLNTANSKDLCLASIEEAFFTPVWGPLLALFRKVHRQRELSFESSMTLYRDASPDAVGVSPELYPQDPAVLRGSYPYESAVQELRLLSRDCCPQKKLDCIVRTLRVICACAEDYGSLQEEDSKTASIGADDLLPILSYVTLRCELPQLVSECAALEEFIHEGYLIGEEGYCLTSMQSALQYVESLHTRGFQLHNSKLT